MSLRNLWFLPFFAACVAPVGIDTVAEDLSDRDVVFLGEEHDNDSGHAQQFQLLQLLHSQRPNLVLSMEMFERDVQDVLDDYLDDRMDEETFLDGARPWPRYRQHYRPMVEYCKAHGLRVLAANLPRSLALQAAREGAESVLGEEFAPRATSAPRDGYWDRFKAAMSEHSGVEETESMWRFYEAQCLKDDAMAESIQDLLEAVAEADRPLVVHVTGGFHSEYAGGTVSRLRERMPDLSIGSVAMQSAPNAVPGGQIADWILRVPAQPEEEEDEGGQDEEPTVAGEDPAPGEGGRPALGFMPGYGDDVMGAQVDALVEGGPAERAGLIEGDIIIQIGDTPIESLDDYMSVLADQTIGATVQVTVDRAGEQRTFDVVVGRRSH